MCPIKLHKFSLAVKYITQHIIFWSGCTNFHSISPFPGCSMDQVEHMLYAMFASKNACRALSKMSFELQDLNGGFTQIKLGSLNDLEWRWEPWKEQPLQKKVALASLILSPSWMKMTHNENKQTSKFWVLSWMHGHHHEVADECSWGS